MISTRFHLAFPVHDLGLARKFYTDILECEVGRESSNWIDFNLFGHQIVAHLSPEDCNVTMTNYVDGDNVPIRHFGLILPWNEWEKLYKNLQKNNIIFHIKPKI
jgi:extradiol dioxygenase family protein